MPPVLICLDAPKKLDHLFLQDSITVHVLFSDPTLLP